MRPADREAIGAVQQLAKDYGLIIEGILRPADAPELVIVPAHYDPEEGYVDGKARCSDCGSTDIVERDMGQRENDIEVDETGSVYVSQDDGDFHTITWLCQTCGQCHDLPEGVDVDWS